MPDTIARAAQSVACCQEEVGSLHKILVIYGLGDKARNVNVYRPLSNLISLNMHNTENPDLQTKEKIIMQDGEE